MTSNHPLIVIPVWIQLTQFAHFSIAILGELKFLTLVGVTLESHDHLQLNF